MDEQQTSVASAKPARLGKDCAPSRLGRDRGATLGAAVGITHFGPIRRLPHGSSPAASPEGRLC